MPPSHLCPQVRDTDTKVFSVSLDSALYLCYCPSLHCFSVSLLEAKFCCSLMLWRLEWSVFQWALGGTPPRRMVVPSLGEPSKIRVWFYVQNNTVFECPNHKNTVITVCHEHLFGPVCNMGDCVSILPLHQQPQGRSCCLWPNMPLEWSCSRTWKCT